jgi:hypothetical protein
MRGDEPLKIADCSLGELDPGHAVSEFVERDRATAAGLFQA